MKFAFIKKYARQFPVRRMCQLLQVSASGYYAARHRVASKRTQMNEKFIALIRASHIASDESYGSPRIYEDLQAQGYQIGRHRVARLMRKHGISAKNHRKRYKKTTQSRHPFGIAPNLLQRKFHAPHPNHTWLADITYIPTRAGWLYLAAVMDLFSRRIVGWAMDVSLKSALALRALQMALTTRQPGPGLIHHSDRGVQYAGAGYQQLLQKHQVHPSMSRTGNCLDNAPMESFFGSLKTERVHHRDYFSHQEARTDLFAYLEGFYNSRRRHSALGYLSPAAFEAKQNALISVST